MANNTEDYRIDKGVFKLLYNYKRLSFSDINQILTDYAEIFMDKKRPRSNRRRFYFEVSNHAQENFADFKKFVNKSTRGMSERQDYDDWYQEASMDGSLAYNGVADDF
jgi:hypothetical protein